MPTESFVSETELAIVIFRSQFSPDLGFKLRARSSKLLISKKSIKKELILTLISFLGNKPPRTTPGPILTTTSSKTQFIQFARRQRAN